MPSSFLQHFRQLRGLVDLPILLRCQTDARAIRAAALVGATEGGRRRPGGRNQLGDRQPRSEDLGLEGGNVLRVDQRMIDRRDRVLPDEFLGWNLRAEIARARAHVAVRELEPGAGKGVGELLRVIL